MTFQQSRFLIICHILKYSLCFSYVISGAYGVVTLPFSVREGINIFLAGFVPAENLRFRDESHTFKGNFELKVAEGEFTDSQIVVMLGENGIGKTTFIRMLAGLLKPDVVEGSNVEIPEFNVSYKPQKISPKFQSTVRHLLHQKIRNSTQFC
ncbi:hypothetical protein R3W88_021138 [Solanum pinnatisectum]|uniref:ABC transporter domain-containing protein n=1 Tax=Solanum pinnatisectum TaxID=50273 RepID=A0AAV9LUI8_9SOLN|nr:hypothetical protein R3W88_021138 [Solanum pinnatisectum]